MTRRFAAGFAVAAILTCALAANDLPKNSEEDSFEIEPPLLIPNRDSEPISRTSSASPAAVIDVQKLEKDLERAKRSAGGAERLFRMGVLAKLDVEKRALRVVRLEADLQKARLLEAKENAVAQERRFMAGEIAKPELVEAEALVDRAVEAAKTAAVSREQAELAAAEINLQRQRKLLALGSGRWSEVTRAAAKLAELKTAPNN